MKKIIAVVMSLILLLSFAACSKKAITPNESSASSIHSSLPDSSSHDSSLSLPKDLPLPVKETLPNGVNTFTLDFTSFLPEMHVREIFAYDNSYYALLMQEYANNTFGPRMELYFVDAKTGKVLDDHYSLEHDNLESHYVLIFENSDGYYICCDTIAYVITGSPETKVDIQKIDYNHSVERDDSIIRSGDGKWYAYTEDDAVLVNVETGEKIVPYVGRRESEDVVTHTASRPAGFSEDYFFFRTVGYEWANGYGTYNLKTGEIKIYDDLVDLHIEPSNANSDRFPYVELWLEFGYIDVSDPSSTVTLFNKDETTSGEIYEALKGCGRFQPVNIGNGKYLCVFAEEENNNNVFAAIDAKSLKVVYSKRFGSSPSYPIVAGNSAAFLSSSIESCELMIVSLP